MFYFDVEEDEQEEEVSAKRELEGAPRGDKRLRVHVVFQNGHRASLSIRPSVLMSLDGTPGSREYGKQSAEER